MNAVAWLCSPHAADKEPSLRIQRVRRAVGPTAAPSWVPEFIDLGVVEARTAYQYPRHREDRYQVILVKRGTYRCGLNETLLSLGSGQGVLVQPDDLHEDFCEPPLCYLGVNFRLVHPSFGRRHPRLLVAGVRADEQCFSAPLGTFQPLIEALCRETARGDSMSAPMQDALLMQLFWCMIRRLPERVLAPGFVEQSLDASAAGRLSRFFSEHAEMDLDVAQLARRLHMRERTLRYQCKKALGMSPAQAFLLCRLRRASELLERTDLSLVEISGKLSFSSSFQLSRAFKRHFGASPSQWRRLARPAPAASSALSAQPVEPASVVRELQGRLA